MSPTKLHSVKAFDCALVGVFTGVVSLAAAVGAIYSAQHDSPFLFAVSVLANVTLIVALFAFRSNRITAPEKVTKHADMAEVTHAARLALAGEITASIVHEVIQPLSALSVNIEALELWQANDKGGVMAVGEIVKELKHDQQRAHDIALRLRRFLSKRELQLESVDMNVIATRVMDLLRTDIKKRRVAAKTILEPGLPRIHADPVHLQQVLLALLINAMEAMGEVPEALRMLQVTTNCSDKRRIEVIVSDTGPTMTQTQFDHAFDPFFTTKKSGMGLGLSVTRSIVVAHHGEIWIERRPAGGTSFHFAIPVAKREEKSWEAEHSAAATAVPVSS